MTNAGHPERGASSVEYALLIALIAAVIIMAVGALGTTVSGLFNVPGL
ncbi:Flp family type IVb pilin [Nocardioides montaniterrae]